MKIKLILFSLFVIKTTFADIGNLDSRQGNIFALKNNTVSMVAESVYVSLNFDSIKIYAKFWMYNKEETQNINIYFPIYNEQYFVFKPPPEIKNLKCRVNHKIINVKTKQIKEKIAENKFLNPHYYWNVEFTGGDTTEVEVTYTSVWGKDGFALCMYFTYLIGTAKHGMAQLERGKSFLITKIFIVDYKLVRQYF